MSLDDIESYGKDIDIAPSQDPCELSGLSKMINHESDIDQWQISPAYDYIRQVLLMLNDAVKSKPRSTPHPVSPIIQNILKAFQTLRQYLKEVPPLTTPQRFGNRAFRTWLTKVYDNRAEILKDVTTNEEIQDYFCQSFGSWTRIDYGTGHEFNFLAFITALCVQGSLKEEDALAIVFDVFWDYWNLHVEIQNQYHQEPAGSHGAWGLDDYVFLPFLFGSSQLIDHPEITPANVITEEISKAHKDENSYCRWIDFIHSIKHGDFSENSRMLYSLKTLPHFTKLNGGMIKMYTGEVMDRFLVVQHFRFGKILSWQ